MRQGRQPLRKQRPGCPHSIPATLKEVVQQSQTKSSALANGVP